MKNNSGIVLVTVIIMTLVLSIFVISLISTNMNEALSCQHQIERIKAEQLAKGLMWYNYMNLVNTNMPAPLPLLIELDRKKYFPTISSGAPGPNNTTTQSISIAY